MVQLASARQAAMTQDHIDKATESYLLVCWRSGTIIVGGRRIMTVVKGSKDITWHEGWCQQHDFEMTPDAIRRSVMEVSNDMEL